MKTEVRIQGIVSDFDQKRGRGVIEVENGQTFKVRYSAIQGSGSRVLQPGDRVWFGVEKDSDGLSAINVTRD